MEEEKIESPAEEIEVDGAESEEVTSEDSSEVK